MDFFLNGVLSDPGADAVVVRGIIVFVTGGLLLMLLGHFLKKG